MKIKRFDGAMRIATTELKTCGGQLLVGLPATKIQHRCGDPGLDVFLVGKRAPLPGFVLVRETNIDVHLLGRDDRAQSF